jgi:hemerythrin
MRRRKSTRGDADAEMLEKERFRIERQYIELDDVILHGQGSAQILEAAQTLIQSLQLHLTHEEQFRKQISFPVLDDPRAIWKKNMAELLQIESGLRLEEVYAALRLRSFCKGWIHMQKMWTSIFQPTMAPENERARLHYLPG